MGLLNMSQSMSKRIIGNQLKLPVQAIFALNLFASCGAAFSATFSPGPIGPVNTNFNGTPAAADMAQEFIAPFKTLVWDSNSNPSYPTGSCYIATGNSYLGRVRLGPQPDALVNRTEGTGASQLVKAPMQIYGSYMNGQGCLGGTFGVGPPYYSLSAAGFFLDGQPNTGGGCGRDNDPELWRKSAYISGGRYSFAPLTTNSIVIIKRFDPVSRSEQQLTCGVQSGIGADSPFPLDDAPQPCGARNMVPGSNPVELGSRAKIEATQCERLGGAGIELVSWLRFDSKLWAKSTGDAALSAGWALPYSRVLQMDVTPASCAAGVCTTLNVRAVLRLESGELYRFQRSGAAPITDGLLREVPWTSVVDETWVPSAGSGAGATLKFTGATPETRIATLNYANGSRDVFDATGRYVRRIERSGASFSISWDPSADGQSLSQRIKNDVTGQSLEHFFRLGTYPRTRTDATSYATWKIQEVRAVYAANDVRTTRILFGTAGNELNRPRQVIDAAGNVLTYGYDTQGRVNQVWDANNNPASLGGAAKSTLVSYDDGAGGNPGQVVQETLANGTRINIATVSGSGFNVEVTTTPTLNSGAAQVQRFLINDQEQILSIFPPFNTGTGPSSTVSQISYNLQGETENVYGTAFNGVRTRSQYLYDLQGNLTALRTYKDTTSFDETRIVNNAFGQPTSITEPSGTITSFVYDAQKGFLLTIQRQGVVNGSNLSQLTQVTYDPVNINGQAVQVGLPTAVTLPDGTVNRQTYNNLGYPTISTFNSGGLNITEQLEFDLRGNILASVDRRGVRTAYEYVNNPANGQFGILGLPTAMIFDTQGVSGLPARNIRSEIYRDSMFNPVRTIQDAGSGRANATSLSIFGKFGNGGSYLLTQMTDAENRVVRMEYDGFGRLVKELQVGARVGTANSLQKCDGTSESRGSASDRVTRYCYTQEGWPQKTILDDGRVADVFDYLGAGDGLARLFTDARGVQTRLEYDGKGRLAKLISGVSAVSENGANYPAINGETTYSYDANDRIISVIAKLASGTRTLMRQDYDGLGRISQSTDGAGNQTRYSYDPQRDFLLSTTVGANNSGEQITQLNSFDRLGRLLTTRTDPNGKNLSTTYQYAGPERWLPSAVLNPNGQTTSSLYNSLGSVQSVTDALGNSWAYTTNNLGYLNTVDVPGIGANSDYVVDKVGQIRSLSRNGQTESWFYNLDGTIQRYTDFSGQNISSSFDAVGRLLSIDYSGTTSDPSGSRSDVDAIQYWANDLVRSVTSRPNGSASETTSYTYDAANRLQGGTRNGRLVAYSYNLDDTLSQISYWNRGVVNYGYGSNTQNNGLVRSVTPFGQAASNYSYRSSNLLSAISRPSGTGVNTSFAYDTAARLSSMNHAKAGTTQYSASYLLDQNSNRTRISEAFGALAGFGAQSSVQNLAYDPLNRLIRAEYSAIGSTAKREENYVYDAVGNRTSVQQTVQHNTNELNGDGIPDLHWRYLDNNLGQNSAWLMGGADGDQQIGASTTTPVGGAGTAAWLQLTGDMNGDGINEFLWRNANTGAGNTAFWRLGGVQNHVLQNYGPLLTETGADAAVLDPNWKQEAVADINRDGKGDVIWRNYLTGENGVWYMGAAANGEQRIGLGYFEKLADTNWQISAVADFNSDGYVDLVWHHPTAGWYSIWYMGGDGTKRVDFVTPLFNGAAVVPNGGWRMRGAADANRDGTPDIYWHHETTRDVAIWYMADGGRTIARFTTLAPKPDAPWTLSKGSEYSRVTSESKLSYDASDRISSAGFSFDAQGNVISAPTFNGATAATYAYTAANKLLRSVKDGITTEYQYDGIGNLIRQIRAGVTTDYVLDESGGLTQMLGEISGNTETIYAFGPDGLHAQQRWVSNAAQAVEYPLNDGLGSLKAITSASGALLKTLSYDAWGQLRQNNGTAISGIGFAGEQSLADGTTYLRARSYSPALGRFLQRDSM